MTADGQAVDVPPASVDRDHHLAELLSLVLDRNPFQRSRVLRHNQSVVFFRRLDGPPLGSLGVPLTPARSIATDARLFPPGVLAFVRTERPRRLSDGRIGWSPA